jgi:hypothetical protein
MPPTSKPKYSETMPKKTVLLVTDFSYEAKGRQYFREDVELSVYLRRFFNVWISHIHDIEKIIDEADVILIRNTGPQISHHKELASLRDRRDVLLFNDLLGKGDIQGKQHLLELFKLGYPVIPTFNNKEELQKFGAYERYLLKPLDGADSCGVKILHKEELEKEVCKNVLIQPLLEFQYEVSFYFIGEEFQYALYTPNPQKRWELKPYPPTEKDLEFALKFISWNTCKSGIQRVDACRLLDGKLLLMELEDYNPFLSLDLLETEVKQRFLKNLCRALEEQVTKKIQEA